MSNTYYTKTELEALLALSPIVGISEQEALYNVKKYRLANVLWNLGMLPKYQTSYVKGDTVTAAERALRTIIKVAIDLYNATPTEAQIIAAIQSEGWSYVAAFWMAKAVLDLWFSIPTEVGPETLSNGSTFAATWAVVNGFSVAGGKLVYAHNAGPNTATQTTGNFTTVGVASNWYKFDYTISDASGVALALQISTGFPVAAIALNAWNGKHTEYMISNSVIGNFVLSATSISGEFKIDDVQLTRLIPAFLDATGNSTIMTLEGKQRLVEFAINAVRELRSGERTYYGGNPVL